jgi:GNAT superfamily N-acetyltransferase
VIRELEQRDYPSVAKLLGETMLWLPEPNARSVEHWLVSQPPRAEMQLLVAEEKGRVVGYLQAHRAWYTRGADIGSIWVGVAGEARGRGIGAGLYDRGEAHLLGFDPRKLQTTALAGSEGERFAEQRGFVQTRTEFHQRLDLAAADLSALPDLEAARAAEGLRLVPLRAIDDVGTLHELYAAATLDVPADDAEDDIRPDEFEQHILGDPDLDLDASIIVLDGDKPVSLALLLVNADTLLGMSDLTGTLPAYRGRGLARLAKLAVVRAALERGVTEITTENDADNAPILGLNASLGYRRTLVMSSMARELRT